MNKKAIVLLSGGLDSILAARHMQELGIEIVCVTYFIEFAMCGGGPKAAIKAAETLGIPLKIFDITDEYLEMFKNPKHGYGANMNPCIDCKIFMLKKAKEYMNEVGASFLVTGEVLGERPMSQRKDALHIIEKNALVKGILLRPLSGKLLPATLPETEGIIDREKLLEIRGRGRKGQFALAAKYGIKEYPSPSGGCLLTDPGFASRVRELIKYEGLSVKGLKLLKVGRHFRISDKTKLIVGRDSLENDKLETIVENGDVCMRLNDKEGPLSLLRGAIDNEMIDLAARITVYHTKYRKDGAQEVLWWRHGSQDKGIIQAEALDVDEVDKIRI